MQPSLVERQSSGRALKQRVLIFIVSYRAEKFVTSVLSRIPPAVWDNPAYETEVLVIDDESPDDTFLRVVDYQREHPEFRITALRNPTNQGYGGNQKLGYHYAITHGFDVVVLLHGDGQYAPERIPDLIQPILEGRADFVMGSRMMRKQDALRGGMPPYKWIGNQVLTRLQNRILGTNLSEFHSGYRAYRVAALAAIPFQYNSDYFDFDTDIIIQLLDTGHRVAEVPIPTYYGDEISRVNGLRYGWLVLKTSLHSRLVPHGLLYTPKFDYATDGTQYIPKLGFSSSHRFALDRVKPGETVLDVGCGPGFMAQALAAEGVRVISLDRHIHPLAAEYSACTIEADAETYPFEEDFGRVDAILLLDIIEHLEQPEQLLTRLRARYADQAPRLILTTANIGFFVVRFGLLLGTFNYGKRGILDLDHKRLFTFGSLRRALLQSGYEVLEERGIPAPYPLAIGDNILSRTLLALNRLGMRFAKGLFAYQLAVVARPLPTLEHLLQDAHRASQEHVGLYDRQNGSG